VQRPTKLKHGDRSGWQLAAVYGGDESVSSARGGDSVDLVTLMRQLAVDASIISSITSNEDSI